MKAREGGARHGLYRRAGAVEAEIGAGITAGLESAPFMASITRVFKEGMKTAIKASTGFLARGRRRVGADRRDLDAREGEGRAGVVPCG